MPEYQSSNAEGSLAERFDNYGEIIEGIVLRGLEHQSCELKRAVTIDKSDMVGRLEFVKFFQGLANSHTKVECLIVIGADQKEKKFFDVGNASDFDPAKLSSILAKYLSPEPAYEVFNNMKASTGERYVLIVLNAIQPRPVVMLTDGDSGSTTHFRPGDIWIKHNTGLKPATKVDLDLMYEPKIDKEAEVRARQRFEHFREELGPALLSQAVVSTPVPELMVGSRERLARFTEAMISGGQSARFRMLLEMARQWLIDKWQSIFVIDWTTYSGTYEQLVESQAVFYRDEFMPAFTSVVDLGIHLIRFDGPSDWFSLVVDLLVETFETCCPEDNALNQRNTVQSSIQLARPPYEIHLGLRALATYAVFRKRFRFLGDILHRFVRPLAPQRYTVTAEPILFFPFSGKLGLPEMKNGRNEDYWEERIGSAWSEYFISKEKFLRAAAQLELVLEINSYILIQYDHPIVAKYRAESPEKRNAYIPDFWKNPLNPAVPMAEFIFNSLSEGKGIPANLTIEPKVTQDLFRAMTAQQQIAFLGGFLVELQTWQSKAMMQQGRFSFYVEWGGSLKQAIDTFRQMNPK